ncbi:serine O-acetyltransferase [Dickeya zeae]|uniref:serine O-acetyltransferase n=1 Tax=Dickeya zeae TaxID=204042 RepID=UPI00037A7831|nr:serine O-acetyltransferase [Dickeya zeae]AUQ27280.1 serine acetyltransferase [Dickeya zeae]PXW43799.1 serine O-acetyltransferase [Erwinia sp. AG740]UJR56278.1 serine acetyltransferase [Dickeya zeae MS1]UJR60337.1 serine acetyltransferase [Dickeya zeae]
MNNLPIDFIIKGIIFSVLKDFNIHCFSDRDVELIYELAIQDALAFSEKDPCAKHDIKYIALCYKSYYAVLVYRISHVLHELGDVYNAKILSEHAHIVTGIEIHPASRIGRRFVIDHGVGTVIGETVTIGDDCYILQSVILGASGIANNRSGVRHPQIGNNVEIGGFSSLIGMITVGDNVKISPRTILKDSVPSNCKVVRVSSYEFIK